MARIKHDSTVTEIIGSINKKHGGITIRRKHFRDYQGNLIIQGRLEAYKPNKRNYKANPIVGAERANMQTFGAASHLAKQLIDALKNNTPLPPDKQALLDAYKARFQAQLSGKPDVIAPRDKNGNYTIYVRIDNFIRAAIRKEAPAL